MPEPAPPWWQTISQDPWYITGAKALLGEREVEGMRRGEVMPYVETFAPLLFMGRGGRGMVERPMPVPVNEEFYLPPATKKLLEQVRSAFQSMPPDPFGAPGAGAAPPPRYNPNDVFNWEALQYSDRPVPQPVGSPVPAMNKATVDPQFEELAASLGLPSFANYTMRPKVEPIPILPPDEPFTPKEMQTLGELGMKMPPRSPAQIQQDWELFVKDFMSGGGQSGDMHQMPGGLEFGGQTGIPHATQDYDFNFAPKEPVDPRFMSNPPAPTPPPEIDFSQYY